MSRFAILALTLTLAIMMTGAGLGWYIYNTLFASSDGFIRVEPQPQQASIEKIVEKPENNAFEELPEAEDN